MTRPTRATINLLALRHNCMLVKELAPNSKTVAVVKANAYGHGAVAISKALQPMVDALAVASIEEATELRAAGISKPILLLEGPFEQSEISFAAHNNCWLMLNNQHQVKQLENAPSPKPLNIWLKVDTGMHRLGLSPEQLPSAYQSLKSLGQESNLVIATHFASADQPESDYTTEQLAIFDHATEGFDAPHSCANSAAILSWPESHRDYVRPGIMLYGSSPFATPHVYADKLQPVMSLISEVIALRTVNAGERVGYGRRWQAEQTSTIATVATGYGDGYPRHAPNGTPVMVNGQRAKLAGTVSMDMITVDVTGLENIEIGSPVELWGEQISVNEIAALAGTISYELLTRMPSRVNRVYINQG